MKKKSESLPPQAYQNDSFKSWEVTKKTMPERT
jgi:hypothetical protein